ncbi:hypothetical protein H4R19_000931 [Coemansia spiralis]|nr:hypothetical protein H4R19_000931 [Coemansia spiralis]
MLLSDLPSDVLSDVLWAAAGDHVAPQKFKELLPLLAVCRRLRHIALPAVYQCVIIRSRSSREYDDQDEESTPQRLDPNNERVLLSSNADLIVSAGCVGLVKKAMFLKLDVYCDEEPVDAPDTLDFTLLETLHVTMAVANTSWIGLGISSGPDETEFPNVKHFDLHYTNYSTVSAVSQHRWPQLRFPQLETLDVVWNDQFALFAKLELPPSLESISLSGNAHLYRTVADTGLPATKRLRIHMNTSWAQGLEPYDYVGRIVAASPRDCDVRIRMDTGMLPVQLDSILSSRLTVLTITTEAGVSDMIKWIQRFPRLRVLRFSQFRFRNHPLCMTTKFDHGGFADAESIHIQRLHLRMPLSSVEPDRALCMAQYILPRMTSLAELKIPKAVWHSIASFTDESAAQHPHLANIHIGVAY